MEEKERGNKINTGDGIDKGYTVDRVDEADGVNRIDQDFGEDKAGLSGASQK